MRKIFRGVATSLGVAGRAFIALVGICGVVAALANYTMTQGAGTTFGSVIVGGFHYVQMMVCDLTTPAQCAAVSAAGAVKVDGSAVTQTVSGTVTANAGTNLNTSALSTSANQTSQITQETATAAALGTTTDAVGSTPSTGAAASLVSLAKAINNNVAASIPAGTNAIGVVSISPTAASGGWTHFSSPHDNANAPISTTVVAVKSSAVAKFGGYYISNTNATVACLQVFDVATAGGVTLGTTRPDMVYCVPATSGANLELGNGVAMANGIQIAATTTASGSSALGAGLDVTIYFK